MVVGEFYNMADGPHSADAVHSYMKKLTESMEVDAPERALRKHDHKGKVDWEEFVEISDIDFESLNEEDPDETGIPEIGMDALDQIYRAVKTSHSNNRLAGLRAYRIPWDAPVDPDSQTWDNWSQGYHEAGLIEDADPPQRTELTEEGEIFLDVDPSVYDVEDPYEDLGDFYRVISSQNGGEPDGKGIEMFFLYGAGMGHVEVGERAGIPESTARSRASQLQEMDLLDQDYRFTRKGEKYGRMVMDQLERLEYETRSRLQNGKNNREQFPGNSYMMQHLVDK